MKTCEECRVRVATEKEFCPLCGNALAAGQGAPAYRLPGNRYPNLGPTLVQFNLLRRLLIFITLLSCGVSVLVNWLVTPGYWWCFIVIASVLYCWLTIPPLLRRGRNFASQVVLQVFLTGGLVVGLDFFVGYRGWSVSYVVPSLLCAGILAIGLMAVFNRTNWAQYILYQVLMGIFGFIPLVLYLLGLSRNLVMVLVTAGLGLASLLVMLVFGDRTIKSEFKRRFHI